MGGVRAGGPVRAVFVSEGGCGCASGGPARGALLVPLLGLDLIPPLSQGEFSYRVRRESLTYEPAP